MQIFYISRRQIIKLLAVAAIVIVSAVYIRQLRMGSLSVLFNNESIMPIYSVELQEKKVALTFDIGWGNRYTGEILDLLRRYNIKATFFITGSWAQKYPAVVKSIYEEGYEIGNHSLNHLKMTELSKKEMVSEITECEDIIERLTGKRTKLFRAPYGEYNDTLVTTARAMDYRMIQWDIDSLDWEGIGEKDIYDKVISKTGNGSIILFHNNGAGTAGALQIVVEKLRDEGYSFVTVSELLIKDNYYIDNTGRQRPIE